MTAKSTQTSKGVSKRYPGRPLLTRDAIIDAAREMVIEVGAEGVSLRPLAAKLGVTVGALYAHVEDKQQLLHLVAADQYRRTAGHYEAIEADDPIDRLKEICRLYVASARENPELFRLTFTFSPVLTKDGSGELSVAAKRSFDLAANEVARAMGQGKIRPDDHLVKSLAIWAAIHGVASFVITAHDLDITTQDRLVSTVVDNLLNGLAPAK